ncbi:MAG: hypothetical protein GXY10_01990, partial [Clostridiales bacterium]|nr:hypothetical protein [Clostridiales bacterium]
HIFEGTLLEYLHSESGWLNVIREFNNKILNNIANYEDYIHVTGSGSASIGALAPVVRSHVHKNIFIFLEESCQKRCIIETWNMPETNIEYISSFTT